MRAFSNVGWMREGQLTEPRHLNIHAIVPPSSQLLTDPVNLTSLRPQKVTHPPSPDFH